MEHRNVHALAQLLLDLEALRRLDVLEVDAAEGRLEGRHAFHHALDCRRRQLDVEHVDVGEFLEQNRLPLHHGLRRQRPDVAQPKHRRAVGDHADEVGAARVFRDQRRIGGNRLGNGANARRIGQRHVALVAERLGRPDLQFPGLRLGMVEQRARLQVARHG